MTSPNPDTWMPFYMGDFEASTAALSAEEKWGYLKVIFEYWRLAHKGIRINFDKKIIKNISKVSMKKVEKILTFFENKDGFLYHKRIEKEVTKAVEIKEKNARRTEAATAAKKAKDEERNERRNEHRNDALDDHPTTTTTTLKDKSFRESSAHTDFQNLIFGEEEKRIALEAALGGEAAERCWKKWKLHFSPSGPAEEWLKSWGKWVLNERKIDVLVPGKEPDEKPLEGEELKIQHLGSAAWRRKNDMTLNSEQEQFLEDYEKINGIVWWDNLRQWKQGKSP